jgi:hypothetical protein
VPGAEEFDPVECDDPIGGSVPGADDEDGRVGCEDSAEYELVECEDPIGGSVPGADDEDGRVECEECADCDPVEREDPIGGSVPGADDDDGCVERAARAVTADADRFDADLPLAARLYEPPAPIKATVAMAASGRCFLLMFHSFVGYCREPSSASERAGHRCILGSCAGSAYIAGQPLAAALGRNSKCQGSLA